LPPVDRGRSSVVSLWQTVDQRAEIVETDEAAHAVSTMARGEMSAIR
jgi:hypothetical protein